MANSLPQVGNLAFLIFLFLFIYALIGKQFYSSKPLLFEDGEPSPYRFDTIGQSLVTVFILLTSENWTEVCHLAIAQYGYSASLYFVSAICIGHLMLLNLFLAILLRYIATQIEFELKEQQMQKEIEEREDRMQKLASMTKEDLEKMQKNKPLGQKKKEVVID
jgi:voltage-gated sodium channel